MTRDEIDRALNREVSEAVLGAADEGLIQAILALRDVCKSQEERLRALEPCPGSPYYCGPHCFEEGREVCVPVCEGCQIEAPAKHSWNKSGVCKREYCSARKAGV